MADAAPVRVLLVTPNFDNNSLGRTYCLWLLCRELSWDCRVVGVNGDRIWLPLQGSAFAADCVLPAPGADPVARAAALADHARWADVVVAVKPLPTSFGAALTVLDDVPRPLLVDIDDPDIEARTSWRPKRERLPRIALSARYRARERDLLRLGAATQELPAHRQQSGAAADVRRRDHSARPGARRCPAGRGQPPAHRAVRRFTWLPQGS